MSWSITFAADVGGHEPERLDVRQWDITYNLWAMIDATGCASPRDYHGKLACELSAWAEQLEAALRSEPDKYRALNPSNGWGSYEGLLTAAHEIADLCRTIPRAIVQVW